MNKTCIETYSGRLFDLADPNPDDIVIEDIAHALGNICRYTGHCKGFYSVAQHCFVGTELVPDHLKLQFLLHDASEAYLSDISRPLKSLLPDYREIEARISKMIHQVFFGRDMTPEEHAIILDADNKMLLIEAEQFMVSKGEGWQQRWTDFVGPKPNIFLHRFEPGLAGFLFLDLWKEFNSCL